jgi:predicted outer membrane protein
MDHLSQVIELNHLDPEMAKGMMEAISIDISETRSVTLYDVYQNHLWLSPHPEDSIEARWGLEKCETFHALARTTNASIAFIEKTYRKKDPRYADFTIRTQQQLLGRLNEEWTRSECKEPLPTPEKKVELPSPPVVSIKAHRGSKRCEQVHTEIRTAHDSIAFVEKTYRKKDPNYADFTIRTQQQLLERLNEEWMDSNCEKPSRTPEKKARK